MRRPLFLLLLLFQAVFALPQDSSSQDAGAEAGSPRDTLIVLDSSYSMALPADGTSSRLQTLRRALDEQLSRETRYGVMVFENSEAIEVRLPFPAAAAEVREVADSITPWGRSPVVRSVRSALSYAAGNLKLPADVVVFTDGEDDEDYLQRTASDAPPGDQNRLPPEISAGTVRLTVVTTDLDSPAFSHTLAEWVESSGGELISAGDGHSSPRGAPPARALVRGHEINRDSPDAPSVATERGLISTILAAWLLVFRWNMAASALLGCAALVLLTVRWRRKKAHAEKQNARPPVILIEMRTTISRQDHELSGFPVTIGTDPGCTLTLEDDSGEAGHFTLNLVDNTVHLTTESKLHVNGVPRREWDLSPGDQIRFGRYRVSFKGLEVPRQLVLPTRTHLRFAPVPALAAALAIALFIFNPFPLRPPTGDEPRTAQQPPDSMPDQEGRATATISGQAEQLALPTVRMYDEVLPSFDADYLLVHAHPDDESLDDGVLLARLSDAGMKGVVILLTDGQSGRDQYPERPTDSLYPPRDLRGGELVEVRVAEARRALARLGVDLYIRGGLPNYPYNSLADQLPVGQVIQRWGGLPVLVSSLTELIERFTPEIVISPDIQRGPYEHFEHEATGLIVKSAVSRVRSLQGGSVRAHLVAVDPLQTEHYDELLQIDPWQKSSGTNSSYRATQIRALLEHRTQRDASTIGIETRLAVDSEYYAVAYWDPGYAPPDALGTDLTGREMESHSLPE